MKQHALKDHEVAYVGDDIVDAPIMAVVGLPVAVADAADEAKKYALMVTKNRGGRGAVGKLQTSFLRLKVSGRGCSMSTLKLNLPTVLTLSRIVLIPFFVLSVYHHPVIGALVFSIASITDFLDGYLARRSGQITKFGIIMDPIADKFLVISALIVLVDMERFAAFDSNNTYCAGNFWSRG